MTQTPTATGTPAAAKPDETPPEAALVIAQHCLRTGYADLPAAVVAATKNQIIDTLGIALAGAGQPGAKQLRELTEEWAGKGEALLWGTNTRVPAHDAARVNATTSHALDYDDTYERSFMHPAAFCVPTAFAVAELIGDVSGEELITAIALGVDISCRLANCARPGVPAFSFGWHNTTLYGYFGATIVAGKLMGLNEEQLVSALGIAYQQASGNSQAHIDGALTKRLGPGLAAYGGIFSARLAQREVRGATGVFEGIRGFFFQYHGNDYSREVLLGGLGTEFTNPDVSFKPWPSCRGSHTAIDAALQLVTEHKLNAADIVKVTIANNTNDFSLLASPVEKKRHPATPVDAQFSNPWVVASALVDGRVGLEHFTPEAIERGDLLTLAARIETVADDSLQRPGGGPGAARITVELADGTEVSNTVAFAKGEPNNPMSPLEFSEKFRDCAGRAGLSEAETTALLASLERIETLQNVETLSPAAPAAV